MASVKLGSKSAAFRRQGRTWFCTTGLPSDVIVEVGEMSFHLHKFPLISRSGVIARLVAEASEAEEGCTIKLPSIPGREKAFELVAKFCYGVKLELTSANVVYLRCAAEHLEMTEEFGDGNLISQTESFLKQFVFRSWKDSLRALQSCDDDTILSSAEELQLPQRCIDSMAAKASEYPNLFGWPITEQGIESYDESVLWNGISSVDRPNHPNSDWWYEDAVSLSLPLYKRLISAMEARGVKQETVSGSLLCYANRYLPGLLRRKHCLESTKRFINASRTKTLSEEDQKLLLEEIVSLMPMQKGIVPTKFLFGLLRTAKILGAKSGSIANLEKRIGIQLDDATLEDLLMPSFSQSMEVLYDVDCVQRILEHFLSVDRIVGAGDEDGESASLTPITVVARLIDGYLAEVAPDVNLKLSRFQLLAASVPEYARPLDDGLYRAIDIYLKSHPWLAESEREQLCRLMDCQKLSLEACTHAAQNERLPLRIVVQVLFFEQLQLRSSIAGCFLGSENLDSSSSMQRLNVGRWRASERENEALKVGMENMRIRVAELEKECSDMRLEIEKLGKSKGFFTRKLGMRFKSQMCSVREDSVSDYGDGKK